MVRGKEISIMSKNRIKSQFLIVSLLATLMTIMAFAALYPIMKMFIDDSAEGCFQEFNSTNSSWSRTCTNDPMDVYSGTMLKMTPFFIVIAIVLTIVWASLPMREG